MSASFISAAICIGVIGLNLLATAAVLREERLSDARRMVQLVAIWVLPVIGAIVVLFLHPGNRVTGPLGKSVAPMAAPPEARPGSMPPGPEAGNSGDSLRP
jgi:hypothetical protein